MEPVKLPDNRGIKKLFVPVNKDTSSKNEAEF